MIKLEHVRRMMFDLRCEKSNVKSQMLLADCLNTFFSQLLTTALLTH